jgi:hypothetical protein
MALPLWSNKTMCLVFVTLFHKNLCWQRVVNDGHLGLGGCGLEQSLNMCYFLEGLWFHAKPLSQFDLLYKASLAFLNDFFSKLACLGGAMSSYPPAMSG